MDYGQMIAPMNMLNRLGINDSIDPRARKLFDKMMNNSGLIGGLMKRIQNRATKQLNTLADVKDRVIARHYVGREVIDVSQIHGTVDRPNDFDHDFNPLNPSDEERWARVATAMMNGVELPPLELVQVGDSYFVKDGHHRISVSRALGYRFFDAIIEKWEIAG